MRIAFSPRSLATSRHFGRQLGSSRLAWLLPIGVCLFLPRALFAAPPSSYTVLNSYAQPPYVQGENVAAGLAPTLVRLIRKEANLPVPLELQTLPRRRLELVLERRNFEGLAVFLAPEFLSLGAEVGRWSVPVMVDENVLVSMRPLQLSTLDDLAGSTLGGIAGHNYRLLGPYIEAQRIKREDAPDHVSNLKKLCLGRVDFVVMSRSELAGSSELAACEQSYRWRPFPEPQVIVRRVLVRVSDDVLAEKVLAATQAVACGQAWQNALRKYQLSVVGCGTASSMLGR